MQMYFVYVLTQNNSAYESLMEFVHTSISFVCQIVNVSSLPMLADMPYTSGHIMHVDCIHSQVLRP